MNTIHINERINDYIHTKSAHITGGPQYLTEITGTTGGKEQRNAKFKQSRGRWEFADKMLNAPELKKIITIFHRLKGRARSIGFRDVFDCTVEPGEGFARLEPAGLMLVKRYGDVGDDTTHERIITIPVNWELKVNGVVRQAHVDPVSGILTIPLLGGEPVLASSITWSGEFDVRVRLDVDALPLSLAAMSLDEKRKHVQLFVIPVIELFPTDLLPGA